MERLKIPQQNVAKFHKKKGTQIGFGCDGWIEEGKRYFIEIKQQVDDMKKGVCYWNSITEHWKGNYKKHMIDKYVDRADEGWQ